MPLLASSQRIAPRSRRRSSPRGRLRPERGQLAHYGANAAHERQHDRHVDNQNGDTLNRAQNKHVFTSRGDFAEPAVDVVSAPGVGHRERHENRPSLNGPRSGCGPSLTLACLTMRVREPGCCFAGRCPWPLVCIGRAEGDAMALGTLGAGGEQISRSRARFDGNPGAGSGATTSRTQSRPPGTRL
jgi:hypothetical protein